MKRITAILLAAIILLATAGCGAGELKVGNSFYPDYNDAAQYKGMRKTLVKWLNEALDGKGAPFSFELDGVASGEFIDDWTKSVEWGKEGEDDTVTATYTDPVTGLTVSFIATVFADSPSVDWVVRLKNTGGQNSPRITALKGADIVFDLGKTVAGYTLNTTKGVSGGGTDDCMLTTYPLTGEALSFKPDGGRSSSNAWPFYDILGKDCGLMFAIGWTGQWQSEFSMADGGVSIKAGMEFFDAYLFAGEEIRTPSFSLTYFKGDAEYGHNIFRRLIIKHYTPDDGSEERCVTPLAIGSWGGRTEAFMKRTIATFSDNGIPVDTFWVDAGWFGNLPVGDDGLAALTDWAGAVGNWTVNKSLFPSGSLSSIDKACEQAGYRFMLWYELERGFSASVPKENLKYYFDEPYLGNYLVNLASEEGYDWMLGYLRDSIEENGVDIYRQDFNFRPLGFWRANDEEGRLGITEIRYVENLYRLFDTLLSEFDGLMIDNCASGGQRIDIEILKRSLPIWRSDYYCFDVSEYFTLEGVQCHTQAYSYWLPLHGAAKMPGSDLSQVYSMRSVISPAVQVIDTIDTDYAQYWVDRVGEYAKARPLYYGDYYQLLEPNYDQSSVQAYECFRQDLQQGMLVVYARQNTPAGSRNFLLKGLEAGQKYIVTDADNPGGEIGLYTGKQLMEEGVTLQLNPTSAKIIWFEISLED